MLRYMRILASWCPFWQFFNLNTGELTLASSRRFRSSWLSLDWLFLFIVLLKLLYIWFFHLWVPINFFLFFWHLLLLYLHRCSLYFSGNSSYFFLVLFFLIFILRVIFHFGFMTLLNSWSFYIVGVLFYSLRMQCWGFDITIRLSWRLNSTVVYFFKVLVKVLPEHLWLFNGDF